MKERTKMTASEIPYQRSGSQFAHQDIVQNELHPQGLNQVWIADERHSDNFANIQKIL